MSRTMLPKSLLKLAPSLTLGSLGLLFAFDIAVCHVAGTEIQAITANPARPSAQPIAEPRRKLHILVTNDDGIDSPALLAMAKELAKLGDVEVVAPDSNRSGSSHSSTGRYRGMVVKKVALDGIESAYSVSGTPADAVAYGLKGLGRRRPFDVVVSGANLGSNVGLNAHYSGTVGAAMEAVYLGVPGIAVSQSASQRDHSIAARFTRRFVAHLMEAGAKAGVGYNINVPKVSADKIKGVVVERMGRPKRSVRRWRQRGDTDRWTARWNYARKGTLDGDSAAYRLDNITVVPIRLDWTDEASVKALRAWGLKAR